MRGRFGTKPKLVKWAYTGVIRPKLTYACMNWCNSIVHEYQKVELRKLDRLACRAAATIGRTTPQAALNLILDITPLHLHIQELALSAYARLGPVLGVPWQTENAGRYTPHLWYLNTLLEKLSLELPDTDACQEEIYDRHFQINYDSFDGTRKHRQHSEYTIYTDGSKTKHGSGAGFAVYYKKECIESRAFSLPQGCTVFQAEIPAIGTAAEYLLGSFSPKYVKFLSDSQAALLALANHRFTAQTVLDTARALDLSDRSYSQASMGQGTLG
jgi:hypothetical protein